MILNYEKNDELKPETKPNFPDIKFPDSYNIKNEKIEEVKRSVQNEVKVGLENAKNNSPDPFSNQIFKNAELEKIKEKKLISEPIQILQKKKECFPEIPEQNDILLEQSSFGMSVLDRICALEKK